MLLILLFGKFFYIPKILYKLKQPNMKIKEKFDIIKFKCKNPVAGIVSHPDVKGKVFVAGSQGQLISVSINPFQISNSIKIFNQYSMCLVSYKDGFLMGGSNGQLVFLSLNYETLIRKKIHTDCLSSISECDKYIITTGYDGFTHFLNKKTLDIEKTFEFETPIWKSLSYQNKIYISGNPSYCIASYSEEVTELKRFDSFETFNRKLYGYSDERGLTCLSTNSNSYIPCNFILPLQKNFLTFSDECIGILKHQEQMEWKCQRMKQLENGITIKAGLAIGNIIFLGDDEGQLYKIDYELNQFSI